MKPKDTTHADAARLMRRQHLAQELKRSTRLRAEAGITTTAGDVDETEEEVLERWSRVARR
ncbi:hypothetical protein [Streptomyces griseorubiginosus]|uniref:hypothetical protein n=1 Tax=Streptomyces griseorubiginosus TaxID=67304 RepID=UPI001AD78382|nr:hypothetical protein [Streptomyces griseorubiginosus]MBO4257267.1 hypothetical protein [Streptomyces griseorubiginosus]